MTRSCFLYSALVTGFLLLGTSAVSLAGEAAPAVVKSIINEPLQKVGSGAYTKFGFTIYHATLWAPNGKWDAEKPYALEICYARSLSQATMADSTIDSIRDENTADEATLARWSEDIKRTMPAVKNGDVMIGATSPDSQTVLYFNDHEISKTKDPAFTRAFFNIWLGEKADEDLKKELLAEAE